MKDGEPRSWRHFVYGCAHLSREAARESLRLAGATSIAHASKADADRWYRIQGAAAGW